MTAVSDPLARNEPAGLQVAPAEHLTPVSDSLVHLVEEHTEEGHRWTLAMTLSPEFVEAVLAAHAGPDELGAAQSVKITVHVEPNLLPGDPFPATAVFLAAEHDG